MKKTFKTTVALTAAALAASGTTAFAEEVTAPGPATIGMEISSREVSPDANLEAVTEASQKAQEAVLEQGKVVAKAKAAAAQADCDLSDAKLAHAKATEWNQQATLAAISAAEEELSTARQEVTEAEEDLTTAEKAKDQAQENSDRQEKALAAIKTDAKEAKVAVTEAEESVKRAQDALDGTNAPAILEAAIKAQEDLDTVQATARQAQESLEAAKRSDESRTAAISDANRELTQAKTNLGAAQADQNRAGLAVSDAQNRLSDAQEALTRAQNDLAAVNTITLSQDYVRALKAYAANAYPREVKAQLQAMNAELLAKNTFKANANDASTAFDPDNLSQDVREELTRFWVDLNNQVRRQMGTAEVVANRSAMAFAKEIADGYTLDRFDFATTLVEGHDRPAIQAAAAVSGLDRTTVSYENKHSVGTKYEPITRLTLSQLKEYLYKSMLSFLFNGDEYFHAMSISGAPGYGVTTRYVGVDFSNYADIFNIHVLSVGESHIKNRSLFDTTDTLTPAVSRDSLEQAVDLATREVSRAANTNRDAQDRLETAKQATRTLQGTVADLEQRRSQLIAQPEKAPEAQKALETVTLSLTQATTANVAAQEAKELVLASQSRKRAALEEAKQLLASKKSAYQALQKEAAEEETAFNQAQEALAAAEATVAERADDLADKLAEVKILEDRLGRLKAAPHLLSQAREALEKTQEEADKDRQLLEDALAKQEELEAVAAAIEEKRVRLLSAYEDYLDARQTESRLQGLSQEVAKATVKTASLYRNHPLSTITYSGQVYGGSQLPKTGASSETSLLAVGITLLLSAFGLRRRKEQ